MTDDSRRPRSSRSAAFDDLDQVTPSRDDTPSLTGPKSTRTILTSRKKELTPSRFLPFEQSRSFIAAIVITSIALVVMGAAAWYFSQIKELDAAAVQAAKQREKGLKRRLDPVKEKTKKPGSDPATATAVVETPAPKVDPSQMVPRRWHRRPSPRAALASASPMS